MINSEVLIINDNRRKDESEKNSNKSLSSINISENSKIDTDSKNEILFLLDSGYDKHKLIKVYLLLRPKNISEAVYFLSKEDNLYQHIFYPSKLNNNCEICEGKEEEHISISINPQNSISSINEENNSFESEINNRNICKICEEAIENEQEIKRNKCRYCQEIFCDYCYYNYLKESIIRGKPNVICPNCSNILKEGKIIQKLYETCNEYKSETPKLINILKKNILRVEILQNKNMRFCPIINCDSYAKRENENDNFVKCLKGHEFCFKCGKKWHKDKKCENEEEIDELFEKYKKKYNSKECPNCKIITNKNGGCNHIKCTYCHIDWCWICGEKFQSTEEHYNNPNNNKCFERMFDDNVEIITICSKCLNEFPNLIRVNDCEHFICNNCFENAIKNLNNEDCIKNKIMKVKCPVEDCEEGYINDNITLNYLKTHNNDLYIIFQNTILKSKIKNYDFSIKKKFFHFDLENSINIAILDFLAVNFGIDCIGSLINRTDNCLCKVFLYIIAFFQMIIVIALYSLLSIIQFQIISRELYYDEIYEFIHLIQYNWLFYLNAIMFEILNVINFFQILIIYIIYSIINLIFDLIKNLY